MNEKKPFERPAIVTYRRDELIVETAFTGVENPSLFKCDRVLKQACRPVATRAALERLLRLLPPVAA